LKNNSAEKTTDKWS